MYSVVYSSGGSRAATLILWTFARRTVALLPARLINVFLKHIIHTVSYPAYLCPAEVLS